MKNHLALAMEMPWSESCRTAHKNFLSPGYAKPDQSSPTIWNKSKKKAKHCYIIDITVDF